MGEYFAPFLLNMIFFYRPDGHGSSEKPCTGFCLLVDTKSISISIYIVCLYCSILEKGCEKGCLRNFNRNTIILNRVNEIIL